MIIDFVNGVAQTDTQTTVAHLYGANYLGIHANGAAVLAYRVLLSNGESTTLYRFDLYGQPCSEWYRQNPLEPTP